MSHSFHHPEITVKFFKPFFLSLGDCYFKQKQGNISLQLSSNINGLNQTPSSNKPAELSEQHALLSI